MTVAWLLALDRRGRVAVVPFQKPGAPARYGLTVPQCERAAWSVEPGGRLHRGAGAIWAAISWALGFSLPIRLYYALPSWRCLQDRFYLWVANHRHRMPGVTPWCVRRPEDCR